MKKIITYGTFDLLHVGHLNLLERLRALGDHLTVAVSTDEFNAIKGKTCVVPFDERVRLIAALRCVDAVIAESDWAQKPGDIATHGIHVFGMGSDWTGRFDDLTSVCDVVYLPRTDGISTTILRQVIVDRDAPPIAPQAPAADDAGPARAGVRP